MITPPVCDRCGDPIAREARSRMRAGAHVFVVPNPRTLCPKCRSGDLAIDRSRSIGEYDGTLREIIHALKYSGRLSVARRLAALMVSRGTELLEDADCVVPVPLHWRREYRRGFNQAREIARHLGVPVAEVLVRTHHTRPQVELPAHERHANVEAAFALRRPLFRKLRTVFGLKVVLVDDVSTTGATLEACARLLKQAGASEVFALTAARVVTRPRVNTNPQSLIPNP
jgi:ComF family protein